MKKILFVQQIQVFCSDKLKNAYYTNTLKFYLHLKSTCKKIIFVDFWQKWTKLNKWL